MPTAGIRPANYSGPLCPEIPGRGVGQGLCRILHQADRKTICKWIDEPHKVIRKVAKYYKGANVEFRKYRCKNVFADHSIEQMGEASKSLKY
jgi:hypothetical protein